MMKNDEKFVKYQITQLHNKMDPKDIDNMIASLNNPTYVKESRKVIQHELENIN